MSSISAIQHVKEEIRKVNHEIDRRILRGQSYRSEARYHKDLLRRLNMLARHSWFERTFLNFSLF